MDLDLSEEQELLRETTRRICDTWFDSNVVRALERQEDGFNADFWKALADAGLCGLRIDEQYHGAALGSLDMAILFEEFGRSLASSPFKASCIHSAALIASKGGELASKWLPSIANGEAKIIPAWLENDLGLPTNSGPAYIENDRLSGTKWLVPFARIADAFLVHATIDNGHCWALVSKNEKGVAVTPQTNHASQPLFQVSFDEVDITERWLIEASSNPVLDNTFDDVLIATAAEAIGSSSKLLELTCNYANERKQFGRPIAAFQAISHPLAECATELEAARYLTYQAAWAKSEGIAATKLAQMAKVSATKMFRRLATVAVQVHGGFGYSTEGEPQLYYRRSKHHELMHGTAASLRSEIASQILD